MAIATLDGILRLQDGMQTVWELQVDHQLFSARMVAGISSSEAKDQDTVVACALGNLLIALLMILILSDDRCRHNRWYDLHR